MISERAPEQHWEYRYLNLMRDIWENGDVAIDRTGVGTKSIFGVQERFSLANNHVPLLTTKKVAWKTAAREMLWFLSGSTNIAPLVEQGVHIWTDWPLALYRKATGDNVSRDEFEARILGDNLFAAKWGDLGPVYGAQWTNWPRYTPLDDSNLYRREAFGINQVDQVIDGLMKNPAGRRHIITGWNVAEVHLQALPPCHMTYIFKATTDGRLKCLMVQRSSDLALGITFNWLTTSLLTKLIAEQTGLIADEIVWSSADTHLYLNHEHLVTEQLSRTPSGHPKLLITRKPNSIYDYKIDDFEVRDYHPQAHISAPVAV